MFLEKCDRCQKGDENRFKSRYRGIALTLLGGFNTILCLECQNEWHERVIADPLFDELAELETAYHSAVNVGDHEKANHLSKRIREIKIEHFYAISAPFVAEDVSRESAD